MDHKVLELLRAIYGDTSVDRTETRSRLNAIRDEIDIMLDTLKDAEHQQQLDDTLKGE